MSDIVKSTETETQEDTGCSITYGKWQIKMFTEADGELVVEFCDLDSPKKMVGISVAKTSLQIAQTRVINR